MADVSKLEEGLRKLPREQLEIYAATVEKVKAETDNGAFDRKVSQMGPNEFEAWKNDLLAQADRSK